MSGDEPMTRAQASYLKTLSEQTGQSGMFRETLTRQKLQRIDQLRAKKVPPSVAGQREPDRKRIGM